VRNKLIDDYLDWLYFDVLHGTETRFKAYNSLFKALLDIPYIPLHPMDKNRFKDGLELREEYILGCSMGLTGFESRKNTKIEDYLPECSVLEMIIALSVRIEKDIMAPADGKNDYFRWFWGMICTLELDEFDEKHYDFGWIDKIISEFLEGKRAIFEVKNPYKNVRDMQIWDQMNAFLVENY